MSATIAGPVLVLIEHDRGVVADTAFQALVFARGLVAQGAVTSVDAVLIGADADPVADSLRAYGVGVVWQIHHEALSDYAPEAWADAVVELAESVGPVAIVATGSDRGNEVLAHVGAVLDAPFAANVTATTTGDDEWTITRTRWGGSLLENATLRAPIKLISTATHAFSGEAPAGLVSGEMATGLFTPTLSEAAARTRIVDRVSLAAGITLTTAPVVVSGGRGVGSPDGFAILEELAGLLGGAVGCSRVVTNNGWRPHADQVGQTGKRVAPDLYIACGISGAIQHWVGMMAAKKVLAINIDGDANMVSRADYAVIGDLHEVLPAIIAELKARKPA